MNDVVKEIRERFAKDHPKIFRQDTDTIVEVSADERDVILDGWAQAHFDESLTNLRSQRNALLASSDWTQAADAPVDAKAWAAYRQALRDLPATIKDPTQPVDWPTPPE